MPNRTLLDRPVRGDHPTYSSDELPTQEPIESFLTKLDALFAFPEVEAIRWEQFTPYFNDGDVCTFGVCEPTIKLAGVTEGGDREDGFTDGESFPPDYWDTHYKSWEYGRSTWDRNLGQYVTKPEPEGKVPSDWSDQKFYVNGVERQDIQEAYEAVHSAISSEVHAIEFQKVFGDPAQVTATREGFDVEFYDHD